MTEAAALAVYAVLFAGGVFVLGAGAWVWSRAAQEMVRARAHSNQADAEEFIREEAERAVETAPRRRGPPSAEEIANVQRYTTEMAASVNGEVEYTDTLRNEGIESTHDSGGGMYKT